MDCSQKPLGRVIPRIWGATLFGVVLLLAPRPVIACTPEALARFIAAAQKLDKEALPSGDILRHCPQVGAAANQWFGFLRVMTGAAAPARATDDPPPGVLRSGRGGVLDQADAGNYGALLRHIDAGELGYADAPDAQLVLGRILVRRGQFARGRDAYRTYLALKPGDNAVRAEYLFAFIWAGDWEAAEAQFAAARGAKPAPDLEAALERGRQLLARRTELGAVRLNGGQPAKAAASPPVGTWRLTASQARLPKTYARQTLAAEYTGALEARAAAHAIDNGSLVTASERVGESWLGLTRHWASGLTGAVHGGYFASPTATWMGAATLDYAHADGIGVAVGARRQPLGLLMPLAVTEQGVSRQTLYAAAHWRRLVTYRGELRQDQSYAPHERHDGLWRWRLWGSASAKGGGYVDWRLPLSYEAHPLPSPLYDAPLRMAAGGSGLEAGWHGDGGRMIMLSADYNLIFIVDRSSDQHTRQSALASAALDFAWPLGGERFVVGSGRIYRPDQDQILRQQALHNSVTFGLAWGNVDKVMPF